MRKLVTMFLFIGAVFGAFWVWQNNPELSHMLNQYIENGDVLTLEAQYTPEQIMNAHRRELLIDKQHSFLEPALKFHPYLLIEAKYTANNKKTKEGSLLWSLVDGEIILDTETWDKTHGFQDALLVDASRNEFKILNALAKHNGSMTREELQKELHLEQEIFEPWVDSARSKHLIIQKGNHLQLHFQNPKILVNPQTRISQWLVTKPFSHAQRITTRFTRRQIERLAKAAFGSDFTIRSAQEVSLPIYSIEVMNPDGSIHTSYWNALNGQRINPRSLSIKA